MANVTIRLERANWLTWIGANVVGWLLAYGLAQLVTRSLFRNDPFIQSALEQSRFYWLGPYGATISAILFGTMIGLAIGFLQGLALKMQFGIKVLPWMGATLIFFATREVVTHWEVRWIASGGAANPTLCGIGTLLTAAIIGAIPQWFVLNRRYERAGWWVPGSFVGIGLAMRLFTPVDSLLEWLLRTLIAGAAYGFVTGLALRAMRIRPQFAEEQAAVETSGALSD